jgi:hypothetical protein
MTVIPGPDSEMVNYLPVLNGLEAGWKNKNERPIRKKNMKIL